MGQRIYGAFTIEVPAGAAQQEDFGAKFLDWIQTSVLTRIAPLAREYGHPESWFATGDRVEYRNEYDPGHPEATGIITAYCFPFAGNPRYDDYIVEWDDPTCELMHAQPAWALRKVSD